MHSLLNLVGCKTGTMANCIKHDLPEPPAGSRPPCTGPILAQGMRIHEIAMSARLELVSDTREEQTPEERPHLGTVPDWVKWVAFTVAIVGVIWLWAWSDGAERRAIRSMPQLERQALHARTLQNLKSVCSPPSDALHDFCREQAQLVLEFQECERTCQELADRQLSRVQLPR